MKRRSLILLSVAVVLLIPWTVAGQGVARNLPGTTEGAARLSDPSASAEDHEVLSHGSSGTWRTWTNGNSVQGLAAEGDATGD